MNMKTKGKEIGETIFILAYLLFLLIISIAFFQNKKYYFLTMSLTLAVGDAIHLIPRTIKNIKGDFKNSDFYLGFGNQASSITMSIFYLFLTYFFITFNEDLNSFFDSFMYMFNSFSLYNIVIYLVIIRIILCLLPQNNWYKKKSSQKWAIIRNIPFVVIGIISVILAFKNSLVYLGILILLSFLFYIPVVLFARKNKKIGMLMIPKTICYILIILYLFNQI